MDSAGKRLEVDWDGLGRLLVSVGLGLAVAGVPLAHYPWGYNAYGPVKLTLLSISCVLMLLGVLLDRGSAQGVMHALRSSTLLWVATALVAIASLSLITSVEIRQSVLGSYPGISPRRCPCFLPFPYPLGD